MILDEIIRRTGKRVAHLPATFHEDLSRDRLSLAEAIRNRNGGNAIIAEIKCASPSRGVIQRNVDMAMMAGVLEEGGCVVDFGGVVCADLAPGAFPTLNQIELRVDG